MNVDYERRLSPIGALPPGWELKQLSSLCTKIGSGATPRGGQAVYLNERSSHALVRSQHVFDRYFSTTGLVYISEEHAQELRNVELQSQDLLLNITGDGVTFGRVCIVPDEVLPACVNQHVAIIRLNKELCVPGYLLAYLTLPLVKPYIESFNAGGSRRAITKGSIESFEIPLPSLETQAKIAQILGSLDDKIELNRQMNQTLEAMAKAIFQSWFVDFEPVKAKQKAKAAGKSAAEIEMAAIVALSGKSEEEFAGLGEEARSGLAETAGLFGDELVESELGLIPDGWEVKNLAMAFEINPRRSLSKGAEAAYLDMKNMPTEGHYPHEVYLREFGSGMKFVNGDTLLARITPCLENGKTAYVDFLNDGEVGWGSTEYIVFRPKFPLPLEFGYFLARSSELRSFAVQNMSGTSGRQRVPAQSFEQFFLPIPTEKIALAFGNLASGILQKIKANCEQSQTLAELRDSLLPKLLSGELTLPTAQTQATEVLVP
jgi:type I restriction enzyme, S subunit